VAAADRPVRIADAHPGLLGGAGHLDLVGCGGRGHLDRAGRIQPGHVAEDAVAPLAAEVVVDHLGDPGHAVAADRGPGPEPADRLGLAGHPAASATAPTSSTAPASTAASTRRRLLIPMGRDRRTR
jgi:hypothetical protein